MPAAAALKCRLLLPTILTVWVVCLCFTALQVAAVLIVTEPELRAVMQQELPVICLLAKLEPSKVRPRVCTQVAGRHTSVAGSIQ